jgi:hypothetical protein
VNCAPPSWPAQLRIWSAELLAHPQTTLVERVSRRVADDVRRRWDRHIRQVDGELIQRASATLSRLSLEELLRRAPALERGRLPARIVRTGRARS